MLKLEQNHGIKYILDRFERFRWKFQFEKRNEMQNCLENLLEIDNIMKKLRKESPEILEIMQKNDPKHIENFVHATCMLMQNIISLMKAEEKELEKLNDEFIHAPAMVENEKKTILNEEQPEESYAKKLETWANSMKKVVSIVYKSTKHPYLKIMLRRLQSVSNDMKWFESTIEKEEKIISKTRKAVII